MPRVTRKQAVAKKGKGRGTRRTASRVRSGARSKRCTRPSKRYPRKRAATRCTIKGGSSLLIDTTVKIVTIEGELNYLNGVYKKNSEEEHLVKLARDKCLQHINRCTDTHKQMSLLAKFFTEDNTREYWFGDNGYRLERITGENASCIGNIGDTDLPIRPDGVHSIELEKGTYILSSNNYSIPPGMGPQLGTPLNEEDLRNTNFLQDSSTLQVGHMCAVLNGLNPKLNNYKLDTEVPHELIDFQQIYYQRQEGVVDDWVAVPRSDDTIKYGQMTSNKEVTVDRFGSTKSLKNSDDRQFGVYKLKPSATFSYACVQSITKDAITLRISSSSYQSSIYIAKENFGTNIKTLPLSSGGPYLKPDKSWLLSWLPRLIKESNENVLISNSNSKWVINDEINWQSVDKYGGTFSVA